MGLGAGVTGVAQLEMSPLLQSVLSDIPAEGLWYALSLGKKHRHEANDILEVKPR